MHTSFRKDRLLLSKHYALYYGYGKVDELASFDIAIIHPNSLDPGEYEKLQNSNTLIITYLSLMEVHETDKIFHELSEDDFLSVNGEVVVNEEFGTYLVNMKSLKWIDYLLRKIRQQVQILNSDGIFLDTIGDIELTSLSSTVREEQLNAIVNFLSVVKMLYPNQLLIQNNGLEVVCLKTAPYIDGICWENPPVTLLDSTAWVEGIIQRLSYLKDKHRLKIFLLLEESTEKKRNAYRKSQKIAKEHDFLLYNAPANYVKGINIIKG